MQMTLNYRNGSLWSKALVVEIVIKAAYAD